MASIMAGIRTYDMDKATLDRNENKYFRVGAAAL